MTYTEPLILVFVLLALAGLVRRRLALATIGVLGLLLVSWPPVGHSGEVEQHSGGKSNRIPG